jgi:hypothetical protein
VGGVNKWDEAGDAVRSVIRAYHGSPHDFDRFDAGKIGSGEGAQAYGHGLYFAGAEDTADWYRRKLSEDGDAPERWARDFWDAQSMPDAIGSPEDAYDYLLKYIRSIRNAGPGSSYSPGLKKHYAAAEKYLLAQDPYSVPGPIRQGRVYEVEIDQPEGRLIDLDAPLEGEHKSAVLGAAFRAPDNKWQRMAIEEAASPTTRAKVALESIMRAHNSTLPDKMAGRTQSQAAVARDLFSEGIPGLKYFDGVSRNAGEGTRNYVMFPGTEDSIRILRKYAIPGAVGTGVASQYEESP